MFIQPRNAEWPKGTELQIAGLRMGVGGEAWGGAKSKQPWPGNQGGVCSFRGSEVERKDSSPQHSGRQTWHRGVGGQVSCLPWMAQLGLRPHRWAPLGCALMPGWGSPPVAARLSSPCHAATSLGLRGTPKRNGHMSSAFGTLPFKKMGGGFAVSLVPGREGWWAPETFAGPVG